MPEIQEEVASSACILNSLNGTNNKPEYQVLFILSYFLFVDLVYTPIICDTKYFLQFDILVIYIFSRFHKFGIYYIFKNHLTICQLK